MENLKIIGVAIRFYNICICLPKPNRHSDCIKYAVEVLRLRPPIGSRAIDQGFYLEGGIYLNREEAFKYVKKIGQQVHKDASKYLFSEDLW